MKRRLQTPERQERLKLARQLRGLIHRRDEEIARGLRLLTQDSRSLDRNAKWALARIAQDRVFHIRLWHNFARCEPGIAHPDPPLPNGLFSSRLAADAEICSFLFARCFVHIDPVEAAYLSLRILETPVYEDTLLNALSAGGIAVKALNLHEFRETLRKTGLFEILNPCIPECRPCHQCGSLMSFRQKNGYHFYECTQTTTCNSEAIFLSYTYRLKKLHARSHAAKQNSKLYDYWISRSAVTVPIRLDQYERVCKQVTAITTSPTPTSVQADGTAYRTRYKPNFKFRKRIVQHLHPELKEALAASRKQRVVISACPSSQISTSKGLEQKRKRQKRRQRRKLDDSLIIYGPDFSFVILRSATRGRPKQIIDHRKVEHFLARGFNMTEVVKLLGTKQATLYRQSVTDEALRAAIANGRKRGGTYGLRTRMMETKSVYLPNFAIVAQRTQGRPASDIDVAQVEALLARGLKMPKVAKILRTSRGTIYRRSQTDPTLKTAIINGRKKGGTYTHAGGLRIPRNQVSSLSTI